MKPRVAAVLGLTFLALVATSVWVPVVPDLCDAGPLDCWHCADYEWAWTLNAQRTPLCSHYSWGWSNATDTARICWPLLAGGALVIILAGGLLALFVRTRAVREAA